MKSLAATQYKHKEAFLQAIVTKLWSQLQYHSAMVTVSWVASLSQLAYHQLQVLLASWEAPISVVSNSQIFHH